METMKGDYPIRWLCEVLEVAPSGYYLWRSQPRSRRQEQDEVLAEQIAAAHQNSRNTYGAPRVVDELNAQGVKISRRRCARLMRTKGLRGRKKNRRRPRTTDSRHGRATPANQLATVSPPSGPNQVWITDITYLKTTEGWLYLAAILDLWSRRVIGWATASTLHATLVETALRRAIRARRPLKGLLHHSDRGSQYVDDQYVNLLAAYGINRSMSRAGNCYDNAVMESFWSTLKSDTELDILEPASRAEAELAVFDYIETFYNPMRRHTSLGSVSPVAFEKHNN
jgi:transposase InsO family protein